MQNKEHAYSSSFKAISNFAERKSYYNFAYMYVVELIVVIDQRLCMYQTSGGDYLNEPIIQV